MWALSGLYETSHLSFWKLVGEVLVYGDPRFTILIIFLGITVEFYGRSNLFYLSLVMLMPKLSLLPFYCKFNFKLFCWFSSRSGDFLIFKLNLNELLVLWPGGDGLFLNYYPVLLIIYKEFILVPFDVCLLILPPFLSWAFIYIYLDLNSAFWD